MYLEDEIKHVKLESPTIGDLIEALKQFPLDAEITNTPIEIKYDLWSNEDSSRERIGYHEYKLVRIE